VGGGGVGKTTCALLGLLYARCKGLNVNATALVSERAQELGVLHLNSDYAIPRVDFNKITAGQLAERIISSLYRSPEKFEFHRTVDVELIDEMGPIPAEIWSARDIVLRYIRNSKRLNGGKLDLVTLDHLQTHPVQGTHPLLCPIITTSYLFLRLKHSVRAATSPGWQRIQAITRMDPSQLTDTVQQEFVGLITTHCTFVSSEKDVPPDVLFVYGKNAPVKMHQARLQRKLSSRRDVLISESVDLESKYEGRFIRATTIGIRQLNSVLREQDKVYFFPGGRYRITFNKAGAFSNGQIAFLPRLPSRQTIAQKQPILLLLSPPGVSYIPGVSDKEEDLIAQGWKYCTVGMAPERVVSSGGVKAKRTLQYGLQLYVGSTWHSTMGKTLNSVATRVSNTSTDGGPYAIWDPTQVVIMLSRTRLPSDTIFISKDPIKTATEIFRVLKKTSPFRGYLTYILNQLCDHNGPPHPLVATLDRSRSVYRSRDVLLPIDNTGFVYMLVSKQDTSCLYIGSCENLIVRYALHNTGHGALQTGPLSLRPWGLLAFISGFAGRIDTYKGFESAWIASKERLGQDRISLQAVLDLGQELAEDFAVTHDLSLQFHLAGSVTNATPAVSISSSSSASFNEMDTSASSDNSQILMDEAVSVGSDAESDNSSDAYSSDEEDLDVNSCTSASSSVDPADDV
jgi:hypothetical protein